MKPLPVLIFIVSCTSRIRSCTPVVAFRLLLHDIAASMQG